MRDALWVNPNGSMSVVTVDDDGNRVEPDTTPPPDPTPKVEHSTAHKGAVKRKGKGT